MSSTEETWTLKARPRKNAPHSVPQLIRPRPSSSEIADRKARPRIGMPVWTWAQPGTMSRLAISGSGRGTRRSSTIEPVTARNDPDAASRAR